MGKSSSQTIGYHYRVAYHVGLTRGPIDAFLEFRAADKTAWNGGAQEWFTGGKAIRKRGSGIPINYEFEAATGPLTASGRFFIGAPNLFGGPKDQGGIVGPVDVMFGESTQLPNAYLQSVFGNQVAAWRGMTTLVFAGGQFGAMNPMPQKPAYKICKIINGWDGEGCWYPEKAVIVSGNDTGELITAMATGQYHAKSSIDSHDWSREEHTFSPTVTGTYLMGLRDRYLTWDGGKVFWTTNGVDWTESEGGIGSSGGEASGIFFKDMVLISGRLFGLYVSYDKGGSFENLAAPAFPGISWMAATDSLVVGASPYFSTLAYSTDPTNAEAWQYGAEHGFYNNPNCIEQGGGTFMLGGKETSSASPRIISTSNATSVSVETLPAFSPEADRITAIGTDGKGHWVAATDTGEIAYKQDGTWYLSANTIGGTPNSVKWIGGRFVIVSLTFGFYYKESLDFGATWSDLDMGGMEATAIADGATIDTRMYGLRTMNPAHALYYVRTDGEKGREPRANINDASLRAAADRLYSEGFGLCWEYDPANDTPDSFEERICRIIGGSFERSVTDGEWYLDLARGDYDREALPVIGDDDILDFSELPTTLDRATNSLAVRYFDPERKETIITPAVRALGLIRRFGEIHETLDFPEIPVDTLAMRVADRELRARVTPTRTFELTITPRMKGLRRNQYFRLQSPKRRISDMICIVGSIENGTLKSGAVRLKVSQDVYSLPDTTYIDIENGVDTRPATIPVPIALQRVFEAPYIDVAASFPRAELETVPADAGFALSVAANPGQQLSYTMMVRRSGSDYAPVAQGIWCPTATVTEAASADPDDRFFTLSEVDGAGDLAVGMPVLWDDEIGRLDAIDAEALTIEVARGCADTVPAEHAAGSRMWFFDGAEAVDTTEYTDGESIEVKLLTNTGSRQLSLFDAKRMVLTFDARQARPYPPANVTIAGQWSPASLVENTFTLAWSHRDRVLQADQLLEWNAGPVGPEPGVEYTAKFYSVADGSLLYTVGPTSAASADVRFTFDGTVRLEMISTRDGLECLQPVVVEFEYKGDPLELIETTASVLNTASTTLPVAMPPSVAAGDLLLMYIAVNGTASFTTPSGWTLVNSRVAGASVLRTNLFRRIADGSEGGTTVNVTISNASRAAMLVHRIESSQYDHAIPPQIAAVDVASGVPNPPSLTPTWGPANNLWIAYGASANGGTVNVWPLGSGNEQSTSSGTPGNNYSAAACYEQDLQTSLNPAAFAYAVGSSDAATAYTVAIKPP